MKNSLDFEINHNYRAGYNDGFADGRAEKWIPVAAATPDANQAVIVYIDAMGGGLVDAATYRGGVFTGGRWRASQDRITHWMPVPGEPAEGIGADVKKCVICGKALSGFGNNPWPVKEEGECCDACNTEYVIPARIEDFAKSREVHRPGKSEIDSRQSKEGVACGDRRGGAAKELRCRNVEDAVPYDSTPAGGKPGRTDTVEWYTPAEKLPEDDILVLAVCRAKGENVTFCDAMELASYDADAGEWILESYPGITGVAVSWWCELPNVPDTEDADDE